MTHCPYCGKQLDDAAEFCSFCGSAIPVPSEGIVTPEIQTPPVMSETSEPPVPSEVPKPSAAPASAPKKHTVAKKALLFAVIPLILIVAALCVFVLPGLLRSPSELVFFLKDGEICFADTSKKEVQVLTAHLGEENIDESFGSEYFSFRDGDYADFPEDYITLNKKETRVFYPDRSREGDEGINLYYRELKNANAEGVKLDSDVRAYTINDAGTQVLYIKGDFHTLYLHDLKEREELADGVSGFCVSPSFDKILYVTEEDSLYLWQPKTGSVRLANDVDGSLALPDLSVLFYQKNGAIYRQKTDGSDREKIASDVLSILAVGETGGIYYIRQDDSSLLDLRPFIIDDLEPGEKAELREALESSQNWGTFTYSLYYYDGSSSTLLSDMMSFSGYYCSGDSLAMTFSVFDPEKANSVRLSELDETIAPDWQFSKVRKRILTTCVAAEDEVAELDLSTLNGGEILSLRIAPDGSAAYFIATSPNGNNVLYKVDLSSENWVLRAPQPYDSNVSRFADCSFLNGDGACLPVYFKNPQIDSYCESRDYEYDYDIADLYVGGREIGSNVLLYSVVEKDGALLYLADWDSSYDIGTLKLYRDGEVTEIAEDIEYGYAFMKNGGVLFLSDYSSRYETGTLRFYQDGQVRTLDDEASTPLLLIDNAVDYQPRRWWRVD